jgi:hypothetical protein
MGDIDKAKETARNTAGQVGMTTADFDRASELLQDYGEKRENLFKAMMLLLGQYEVSGLDSDWRDCCINGQEALRRLNDEIPPRDGSGLRGVGLDSFYRGELKIWQESARAEIALAAKAMKTIHLANLKLIQDCNDDLSNVLSKKMDVQKIAEGTFGAILDVLAKTATLLLAYRRVTNPELVAMQDQIDMLGNVLKQNFSQVIDATAKKKALLQVLLTRIEFLKQTKSRLDKDAIRAAYAQGAAIADALPGLGRDSPYEAADWNEFCKDCKEKLEEECDRATTDADTLFDMLYHKLNEETQKSFAALSNDPAQQERWEDEIGNSFTSIQEALDKQKTYAKSLVDGAFTQGLNAAIALGQISIKISIDNWKSTDENIKQALRKD